MSNLYSIFTQDLAFNQDIGSWNVARVVDMAWLLSAWPGSITFNYDIGRWNTASVATMYGTFLSATAFNQNIASWNVLRVSNFVSAFDSTTALSDCNKRSIYRAWGSTLQVTYPGWASVTCLISDGNIGAAVTAWITSPTTATATYGNIGDWNTAAVTSMASLFYKKPTFSGDISGWNTAAVSNMASMFNNAATWNQDIVAWNVLRVSNVASAFDSTTALSIANKLAWYRAWGATLQAAYPSWTAAPTARSRARCSHTAFYKRRMHRSENARSFAPA